MTEPLLPITLLSGLANSGKATLLANVLTQEHKLKVSVCRVVCSSFFLQAARACLGARFSAATQGRHKNARIQRAHECTHSYTHTLILTHRHRRNNTHSTYMHTNTHTCARAHTHTHTHTHTYTHTHINTHINTYKHTHTQMFVVVETLAQLEAVAADPKCKKQASRTKPNQLQFPNGCMCIALAPQDLLLEVAALAKSGAYSCCIITDTGVEQGTGYVSLCLSSSPGSSPGSILPGELAV